MKNKSKDKLYIEILKIIVNIMQGKQVPTFIISLVILLLSKFMPQIISSTNVSDTHRAQHLQTWTSGQGTSEMHCLLSKHTLFSGDIQRGTVVRGQKLQVKKKKKKKTGKRGMRGRKVKYRIVKEIKSSGKCGDTAMGRRIETKWEMDSARNHLQYIFKTGSLIHCQTQKCLLPRLWAPVATSLNCLTPTADLVATT